MDIVEQDRNNLLEKMKRIENQRDDLLRKGRVVESERNDFLRNNKLMEMQRDDLENRCVLLQNTNATLNSRVIVHPRFVNGRNATTRFLQPWPMHSYKNLNKLSCFVSDNMCLLVFVVETGRRKLPKSCKMLFYDLGSCVNRFVFFTRKLQK